MSSSALHSLNDTTVCVNHIPSPSAALNFQDDENVLPPTIMMICDKSRQQFQPVALLPSEQMGLIEWRVGDVLRRRGRDQIPICHLALVAMETDDFHCTMMEPMGR